MTNQGARKRKNDAVHNKISSLCCTSILLSVTIFDWYICWCRLWHVCHCRLKMRWRQQCRLPRRPSPPGARHLSSHASKSCSSTSNSSGTTLWGPTILLGSQILKIFVTLAFNFIYHNNYYHTTASCISTAIKNAWKVNIIQTVVNQGTSDVHILFNCCCTITQDW